MILCQISLVTHGNTIESIITRNACDQLDLKENDTVVALIKTNEISLSPND